MLEHLHVKNLAIIDEVDISFGNHLNILTGETGAGKSVIIGSISLALGAKASRSLIRKGAAYASVELVFQVEERLKSLLEAYDVYPEDGQVILSRRLTGDRSISKINGESVTLSRVREVASLLLDIHGQHEHQSLLHIQNHLEILDRYGRGETEAPKAELRSLVQSWRKKKKELETFTLDEEKRLRELSFLEYEWNEIEEAQVKPGEEEELAAACKKMSNAKMLWDLVQEIHGLCGGDEGAADLLGRAVRQMGRAAELDEEASGLLEQLRELEALLDDFNREIASYQDGCVFEEDSLTEMEERLDTIRGLMAKHGGTYETLMAYQQEAEAEIERYRNYELYRNRCQEELAAFEEELAKRCQALSEIRKKYAKELAIQIKQALQDLNFLDVQFEISFRKLSSFTELGNDEVQFLISTNPGEPVRPLSEVASGGELSRIMLAVKSVMAEADAIPTLIFDEIDVGISGRTAQKVSEKMATIARNHQVLAITHLAQIAAMADSHFIIEKEAVNDSTATQIRQLLEEESIEELARILGGAPITEIVRKSALEMKKLANETKAVFP